MSPVRRDCLVQGALALTLHVSRLFGMAPLRMTREHGKWRVSVSTAACIYSYIVVLSMNVALLTGLAIDLTLEPNQAVNTQTPVLSFLWIIMLIMLLSITTAGLASGPARMKEMIYCLNIIEKIHMKSNDNDWKQVPGERKRYIATILCFLVITLQQLGILYSFSYYTIVQGRNVTVMIISSIYYVQFYTKMVLKLQFVFVALRVNVALKFVNDSLNDLIYISDQQSTTSTKQAQEKVRSLLLTFGEVCDVMRRLNTSFEKVLLLLMGSVFLHLVIRLYYLVAYVLSTNLEIMTIALQIIYLLMHIIRLVIAVEPGHQAEGEIERTSMLVIQLLRRMSSPRDRLAIELEFFYKQIMLNKVSYTLLGVCKLARPLIASVCSAVTTSLVIILQFQALNKSTTVQ